MHKTTLTIRQKTVGKLYSKSTESPIRNILTYQDGAELVVRLVVQQILQQIEVVDIDKWNVELICAYIRPAYYKATFTVTQVRVRVSM